VILAIIPARGGSKGVLGKNIRPLAGKPLLGYTAEAAKAAASLDRVILTTDDPAIAALGRSLGLDVPFLRPKDISGDAAPVSQAVFHVLNHLAAQGQVPDIVCLLQPTAPLRLAEDIDAALAPVIAGRADSCITVCASESCHPYYQYRIEDGVPRLFCPEALAFTRRQDFPPAYLRNGAVYACRTEVFRAAGSFYGQRLHAHVMPWERSVNIDSEDDLLLAEFLMKRRTDRD
jgi:CMP-N-acetylneuraminic acid synthetase